MGFPLSAKAVGSRTTASRTGAAAGGFPMVPPTVFTIKGLVIFLRSYLLPPGVESSQALAIGSALVFVVFFSTVVGTLAPLLIARL